MKQRHGGLFCKTIFGVDSILLLMYCTVVQAAVRFIHAEQVHITVQ